jgi:hypothetical protein
VTFDVSPLIEYRTIARAMPYTSKGIVILVTMPERSRKRPRDVNELAAEVVREATEDESPEPESVDDGKDPAAVALGRKGGLKGGKARAAKMTAAERSEAASRAARARWSRDA